MTGICPTRRISTPCSQTAPCSTRISGGDVSNVECMHSVFYGADAFNQDIGNWDVSKVTDMSQMFVAKNFNKDISRWNVSKVTTVGYMFNASRSFDQNIGSWNVSNVSNMNGIFRGPGMSTTNYDALLNGWSSLGSLKSSVAFDGGSSKYSSAATAARQNLVSTHGWSITDGGQM